MAGKFQLHVAGDLIMMAAIVIAVIIGAHILFVALEANPANDIVSTDADWAGWFATWFKDMFTTSSYKWGVFLNYGLAALFYLVVGGVLRGVVNGLQKP
ncbi:MAG: hypothetical protein HOQ24_15430 [Mycobacteriaceae bacterium]|nr:hypothetical protein [Mycobacteriaceae bacterium]